MNKRIIQMWNSLEREVPAVFHAPGLGWIEVIRSFGLDKMSYQFYLLYWLDKVCHFNLWRRSNSLQPYLAVVVFVSFKSSVCLMLTTVVACEQAVWKGGDAWQCSALPFRSESVLAGYDSFLIGNRSGPTDWRNNCYLYKLVFIHFVCQRK